MVLQGLEFDSDVPQGPDYPTELYDPGDGWTPRGFGAGVGEAELQGDLLSFEAWLHFEAGPLDRENMNEALETAQVEGVVRWAVLALEEGAVTWGEVRASAYTVISPPNTPHPPIDPALRTVELAGEPGLPVATSLLRSWDVEIGRRRVDEGRYLRAFSGGVESLDYDPASGRGTLVADASCSLSSLIEEGDLEVDFVVGLGLLQLADADAQLQAGTVSGLSETLGAFDQQVQR